MVHFADAWRLTERLFARLCAWRRHSNPPLWRVYNFHFFFFCPHLQKQLVAKEKVLKADSGSQLIFPRELEALSVGYHGDEWKRRVVGGEECWVRWGWLTLLRNSAAAQIISTRQAERQPDLTSAASFCSSAWRAVGKGGWGGGGHQEPKPFISACCFFIKGFFRY